MIILTGQQVKINKKLVKNKIKLTFPGHAEVSMVSAGFSYSISVSVNGGNFHHGLPPEPRALPEQLPLRVAAREGALTLRAW